MPATSSCRPPARRLGKLLALLPALALFGCAAPVPRQAPLAGAEPALITGFQLSGRVAVKYDAQGFSGGLRWQRSGDSDDLLLLSPLGQGVAHIERDAHGVTLTAPDQRPYHAMDTAQLTEQVLGWRLPLDGLRYWVLGVAAPGSAATPEIDADKRLVRLTQEGWRIDYLGYKRVDGTDLPGKIFLQRDEVEVKLVIDAWDAVSR